MATDSDLSLPTPATRGVTPLRARALVLLPVGWAVLLVVVFLAPRLYPSANAGDDLTRNTVRESLLFWLAAVWLMLGLDAAGWRAETITGKSARLCWTLAWLAYLIHLAMAMHYYHGWSHADAMRHVDEVSGFGPGIFFSHLFTLLWTADVAWWWLDRGSYATRSAWIGRTLHAYMAFIIFNGTVVYETGFIRWAGVMMFTVLGARLAWTYCNKTSGPLAA
jgi:hypothetical protein